MLAATRRPHVGRASAARRPRVGRSAADYVPTFNLRKFNVKCRSTVLYHSVKPRKSSRVKLCGPANAN